VRHVAGRELLFIAKRESEEVEFDPDDPWPGRTMFGADATVFQATGIATNAFAPFGVDVMLADFACEPGTCLPTVCRRGYRAAISSPIDNVEHVARRRVRPPTWYSP